MAKKLVAPVYSVYKLTFQSGRTYIGFHKQTKVEDNYVTSSSYYKKNPNDKLISREILIETLDEFAAMFLETWCILSDKAYNKDMNVNKNLGCFYHRFSYAYLTPEQKRAAVIKQKETMSKWSDEKRSVFRENISKAQKKRFKENPMPSEVRNRISVGIKKYFANLSDEEKQKRSKKKSESAKKRMNSLTAEEKETLLRNAHNSQKKKVICVETGAVFDSIKDALNWAGLKYNFEISRSANDTSGKCASGGYHWRWLK